METVNHIIRKNTLSIKAVTRDAFSLQARMIRLLNDDVLPRLSDVFDSISHEQEYLVIERLDIQLEDLPEDTLERDFAEQLIQRIRKEIDEKKKTTVQITSKRAGDVVTTFSRQERALQAFNYFLEKGMLPWWYEVTAQDVFEQEVLLALAHWQSSSHTTLEKYVLRLRALLASEAMAMRLVAQFSEAVFAAVLEAILYDNLAADKMDISMARKALTLVIQSGVDRRVALRLLKETDVWLLQKAIMSATAQKRIREWLLEIFRRQYHPDLSAVMASVQSHDFLKKFLPEEWTVLQNTLDSGRELLLQKAHEPAKPEQQSNLKKEITEAEGAMVKNAGLVIIAPFLPQLFDECKLLVKDEITDTDKAIALLHYLVFGNLDYREYDTVLSKIICGMEEKPSVSIQLIDELSALERSHADEVLRSVIEHWSILKNTSPDGLREGFLQRTGKVSLVNDNWLLKVEQHAVDILLQSLPWTIGMIKLPWMKTMLRTEWN